MKYIKSFNESKSISYFDSKGWEKFLPKELTIVTNTGNWKLSIPDFKNNMNHGTNITHLLNCIQINYYQNTPEEEHGDVLKDGEPDQLQFDITIVKNNDGSEANPDTLKLNVDLTYGNAMAVEFTIEKPNKVKVLHYTGFGSIYDKESFFGFEDQSLKELVNFFNSWGYELTPEDFKFIDKYPDSYIWQKTDEAIKLNPSFTGQKILVLNNSVPQENRYLTNVMQYLDNRGIQYKLANTKDEAQKMVDEFEIIGLISTGSELRINESESDDKMEMLDYALSLNLPIFGICFGMQSIVKHFGGVIKSSEYVKGSYKLTEHEDNELFDGIDVETTNFSFSFNDFSTESPEEFDVIGKLDDKICVIVNDYKKIFGTLFHPEDTEYTYQILDNFMDNCKEEESKEAEELKGDMKMINVIESYSQFISKK